MSSYVFQVLNDHLRILAQQDKVLQSLPTTHEHYYRRVHRMSLILMRQNTPERTAQAVVLRVFAALAINQSGLTRTNIQVSIAVRKYSDIVAEMLHHLELSLPGYSIEQPAQAGPTSFATEGESGRVLRLVTSHDLNAVKWIKDYTSRETTIRTGCYLAVENCKLEDEMQENLGRALVMLFERHSTQDIEKIIRSDGHLSKKIKEIQQSLTAVAEEEANEGRRLRNTKKEMENIQNIRWE